MNKLTANQRFRHTYLVADFVTVILSQSEGLGKMALGIVKYASDHSFSANRRHLVRGQFVRGQFVAVSCRGPVSGRFLVGSNQRLQKLVFKAFLLDVQHLKGQCEASVVCGRQVGRWQLDSKTERYFCCLLANKAW